MMISQHLSVTPGEASCAAGRLRTPSERRAWPVTSRQNSVVIEARASKSRRSGNSRHFGKSNRGKRKGLPPASPSSIKDRRIDCRSSAAAAAAALSSVATDGGAAAAAAVSSATPGTHLLMVTQSASLDDFGLAPRLTWSLTDDYEFATVEYFGESIELKVDFNARSNFWSHARKEQGLDTAAQTSTPQAAAQVLSSPEPTQQQQEAAKPAPAEAAVTQPPARVLVRCPAALRFAGRRQPQQMGGVPAPHSSSNSSNGGSSDSIPNSSSGMGPLQRPAVVVAAGGNVSALATISNASSSGGDCPVWLRAAGPVLTTTADAPVGHAASKECDNSSSRSSSSALPASGLLFMTELAAKQSGTAAAAAAAARVSGGVSGTPAAPAQTAAEQHAMTPGPALLSDDGLARTAGASAFVAARASSGPALLAADGTALTAGAMAFLQKKSGSSGAGLSKTSTAAAAGTTSPALVGAGGFAATAGAEAFLAALVHTAHRQSARVLA